MHIHIQIIFRWICPEYVDSKCVLSMGSTFSKTCCMCCMSLWMLCVSLCMWEFISTFQWVCLNTWALLITVSISPFSLLWNHTELICGPKVRNHRPTQMTFITAPLPHFPSDHVASWETPTRCSSTCTLDNVASESNKVGLHVCVLVCECVRL